LEQLVEVLRYKPEGCGFDSQLCHCFVTGVDSVFNTNGYQEYLLGCGEVKAAGTWADNLTTFLCRLSQPPGALRACPGLSRPVQGLIYPALDTIEGKR
jgi:hypothetical protein